MRNIEYSTWNPVSRYVFKRATLAVFWKRLSLPPREIVDEIIRGRGKILFKGTGTRNCTYDEGVETGHVSTTIFGWECEYVR